MVQIDAILTERTKLYSYSVNRLEKLKSLSIKYLVFGAGTLAILIVVSIF